MDTTRRIYARIMAHLWPAPATPVIHTISPGRQVHKVRRNGRCSHTPCNEVAA